MMFRVRAGTTSKLTLSSDGDLGVAGTVTLEDVVYVNPSAVNTKMTKGVTAKTTDLTEVLALKHTSVSHAFTDNHETDTFFWVGAVATTGGVIIEGINEGNSLPSIILSGVLDGIGNIIKTNDGRAAVEVHGSLEASGGYGFPAGNTNIFGVFIKSDADLNAVVLIDKEGDIYYDGGLTAFDLHDDVALLDALDEWRTGAGIQQMHPRFRARRAELRQTLREEGLIQDRFMNLSRTVNLQTGTLRQMYARYEDFKTLTNDLLDDHSRRLTELEEQNATLLARVADLEKAA
jgi:hypothetical protein